MHNQKPYPSCFDPSFLTILTAGTPTKKKLCWPFPLLAACLGGDRVTSKGETSLPASWDQVSSSWTHPQSHTSPCWCPGCHLPDGSPRARWVNRRQWVHPARTGYRGRRLGAGPPWLLPISPQLSGYPIGLYGVPGTGSHGCGPLPGKPAISRRLRLTRCRCAWGESVPGR